MKNILNRVLLLTVISIMFLVGFTNVEALEIKKESKILEVYQVKAKEEVLVENNDILSFYKTNTLKEELETEEIEEVEEEIEETEEITEERDLTLQTNIVNFSMQFIGNPYVLGGTSLTDGTDCSGFVQSVFANFGIYLPRTTYEQSITGSGVSIEEIEIGDIVSYGYDGNVTHSALYIGDGMIIHASTPELGIRVDNMYIMPIITIRRVI